MSAAFTADRRLRAQAKADFISGEDVLPRWFIGKYKLPTNHPSFQSRTQAELVQEMYSDMYHERAMLRATLSYIDSANMEPRAKNREKANLFARINALNDSLSEPHDTDDALLDEIEAAMERGEEIDLERLKPKPRAQSPGL